MAGGDGQDPFRPQVQGGGEGGLLVDAAVAVPGVPHLDGREEQGQGGGGHDVGGADICTHAAPVRALPGLYPLTLDPGEGLTRAVFRPRDGQGLQPAPLQVVAHPRENALRCGHAGVEQPVQGGGVDQAPGSRRLDGPAGEQGRSPAQDAFCQGPGVGPEHLLHH